mmetsp:Transcript_10802/g.25683  ORF Transcript_10802/g.25683 Transcript_10802/m.25683 type:complete len:96 (-) Transcript_10802:131-418(-)
MLDKKKELAPKESVAGLQSRQEGCPDEWRRIRNLLARDAIDFHKPGSEAEHSSSCIMSAHHSQQSESKGIPRAGRRSGVHESRRSQLLSARKRAS